MPSAYFKKNRDGTELVFFLGSETKKWNEQVKGRKFL